MTNKTEISGSDLSASDEHPANACGGYLITTQKVDGKQGCWSVTKVEVRRGDTLVFEFTRQYPGFALETTRIFSLGGQDILVYSENYETLNFFNLTKREAIALDDESKKQIHGFCPTEILVPKFAIEDDIYICDGGITGEFHDFAFVSGCVWGDDSSWKLNILDMRNLLTGEVNYVNNLRELKPEWLYSEIPPGISLAQCVQLDYWNDLPLDRSKLTLIVAEAKRPNEEPNQAARPTVVCLCGSSRFYKEFQEAAYEETMAGRIYLSIGFYPYAADEKHGEGVGHNSDEKLFLDELHKRKIDMADEVLVVNVGGYIGDSTKSEVAYAIRKGKPIRWREADKSWLVKDGQLVKHGEW